MIASQSLERQAHATVDHTPVERRPGIDGPTSVRCLKRAHQRIEPCLTDSAQVFSVDEQSDAAEPPLDETAEEHVGFALRPVRIVLESLLAREIGFDADASA